MQADIEQDNTMFESVPTAVPGNAVETFEESGGEEFEEDEDIPLVSGNMYAYMYEKTIYQLSFFFQTVNGKLIPLNEVQEEDQRNMSTDEYKVNSLE